MLTTSNSGDRYSVEGVATLYELEPDLVDVVVEGTSDANFLRWYLASHRANAEVYPVDARYDVPEHYVHALGLTPSARNRAIALAVFLVEDYGLTNANLTAFVDADYIDTLGPIPVCRKNLITTDYPSLENYALQDAPLEKFLRIAASVPAKHSATSVKFAVMPALRELYAVRAILAQHDVAIHNKFINDCNFSFNSRGLDRPTAIRKSMGSVMRELAITLGDCEADVEYYLNWFDSREYYCRGHDIATVLFKYLDLKGIFGSVISVERALVACLELRDLDSHAAFCALRERVTRAA